jgi:hypothetical protein
MSTWLCGLIAYCHQQKKLSFAIRDAFLSVTYPELTLQIISFLEEPAECRLEFRPQSTIVDASDELQVL